MSFCCSQCKLESITKKETICCSKLKCEKCISMCKNVNCINWICLNDKLCNGICPKCEQDDEDEEQENLQSLQGDSDQDET